MALEDWKDVVGNAATICTIVQFLVGAQVKSLLFRILFRFSHPFLTGLPGVLSCQVHWRELHYDILGKSFFNFNFFLQIMTSTQVGVVMTFVWMNYGRMVEDSTLQTVNTTGLILQVEKFSSRLSPY